MTSLSSFSIDQIVSCILYPASCSLLVQTDRSGIETAGNVRPIAIVHVRWSEPKTPHYALIRSNGSNIPKASFQKENSKPVKIRIKALRQKSWINHRPLVFLVPILSRSLQSSQYHLLFSAGATFNPTQAKWNHSRSHSSASQATISP